MVVRTDRQRRLIGAERTCTMASLECHVHCQDVTKILLQGACRGDRSSPERLTAVHAGEHRSDQDERKDTERSEEVTFEEEGAL